MTTKEKSTKPGKKSKRTPRAKRDQNSRSSSQVAARNRAIRQESLREQLANMQILNSIEKDYKELLDLNKEIKKLKRKKPTKKERELGYFLDSEFNDTITKAETRHKIIKTQLDVNFRRLKKLLPDEITIEITDPEGANPFAQVFAGIVRGSSD